MLLLNRQAEEPSLLKYIAGGAENMSSDDPRLFKYLVERNGNPSLSVAACRVESIPEQLWHGFASFPRGWAAAYINLTMIGGVFGQTQRKHAILRNQQLAAILWACQQDMARTARVVRWLLKNALVNEAALVGGRFAGGAFTMYALKMSRLARVSKYSGLVSNVVLAGYGSSIMAIANGNTLHEKIVYSILSGRYDGFCFQAPPSSNDEDSFIDNDIESMIDILQNVHKFTQDNGD